MAAQLPDYLSYVIRLWRAEEDGKDVWRVSLQEVQTGQRHGFGCLAELFAYLQHRVNDTADEPTK